MPDPSGKAKKNDPGGLQEELALLRRYEAWHPGVMNDARVRILAVWEMFLAEFQSRGEPLYLKDPRWFPSVLRVIARELEEAQGLARRRGRPRGARNKAYLPADEKAAVRRADLHEKARREKVMALIAAELAAKPKGSAGR